MFDDCTYIGGGRIHFHEPQSMQRRRIDHHRILHMQHGQADFLFDTKPITLAAGDIYLLMPGARSVDYRGTPDIVYEYVEFHAPAPLHGRAYRPCRVEPPFDAALSALLRCMAHESTDLRPQLLTMTLTLALHDYSLLRIRDPRLRRVISMIEEHPDRPRTVKGLAGKAGLSEAQLRRLFLAEFKITPKHYLMRTRMAYAHRLLQAEGLRVQEVADILGFANAFHFSAQYKRFHCRPPSRDRPDH